MRHKPFILINSKRLARRSSTGLKLSALFLLGFGLTGLQAQESINATGGNASGNGGSVSYSVGQLFLQTHTGTPGSIAEGVQQPYEVSVVTAIDEAEGINLTAMAYPNPTNDFLTLEVKDFEPSSFRFQLYDANGKLFKSEKITGHRTIIDVSFLAPGNYFLKVIQQNKDFKTFKIFKK